MQNIEIKAGTSAKVYITPTIKGVAATPSQLDGVVIYVFLVYQFTDKFFGTPYVLTADADYDESKGLLIDFTPSDTLAMLGNASENQKFEVQFAIKTKDGDIVAEDRDSSPVINIVKWGAGKWLQDNVLTE